jgi:hypothetical protein
MGTLRYIMVQTEEMHCWMFTSSGRKFWLTLAPLNKGSVTIVTVPAFLTRKKLTLSAVPFKTGSGI